MKQLLWLYASGEKFFDEIAAIEKRAEFMVTSVGSLAAAIQQVRRTHVDVLLVSLPQTSWSEQEILQQIRADRATLPVIFYGATNSVEEADSASWRVGKAISEDELLNVIRTAVIEGASPERMPTIFDEPWREGLVGSSRAMAEVIEVIRLVAPRRATVLITGETGTGKEIAARAFHKASARGNQQLVAINCAALPEHLLEAELFGHTKGAFTGAFNARIGLFEQANRGTILLDEIGEMPLPLQAKLLRVLQERELQRVGSSETVKVDVRVIAASNTDLLAAVAQKRFRQDLYYRLNVVPLRMPALRERPGDIPELVDHFIAKVAKNEGMPIKLATSEALDYLMSYSWPGNVRQLEHAVESAMALTGARRMLHPGDFNLPSDVTSAEFNMLSGLDIPESGIDFEELMAGIERTLLERALLKSGGNKARAADMLNLKRTTLISKFKALQSCA
ncbi:MAG TPA: sigma-54 dependent transcriptional regulator [Bryobacteraceae bacterium]|nr:sigma-54 dependent transcriptional regulator [Bryobacteraceae bacterium]